MGAATSEAFQYSANTRHRIWRDDETEALLQILTDHYATTVRTPVIKMALRHLRATPPRTRLLEWIRANPCKSSPKAAHMSSWNGGDADMEIVRQAAEEYELTHADTLRLAIRQLAEHNGLVPLVEPPPPVREPAPPKKKKAAAR